MIDWLITGVSGLILGAILYGCVRLRMHFGPLAAARYGAMGRLEVWVGTLVLMIVVANGGLYLLRALIPGNADTPHELVFAGLAMLVGVIMVTRRVTDKKVVSNSNAKCPFDTQRNIK